jgi:hypothetical protein
MVLMSLVLHLHKALLLCTNNRTKAFLMYGNR